MHLNHLHIKVCAVSRLEVSRPPFMSLMETHPVAANRGSRSDPQGASDHGKGKGCMQKSTQLSGEDRLLRKPSDGAPPGNTSGPPHPYPSFHRGTSSLTELMRVQSEKYRDHLPSNPI